ncbi:hypothetical protein XH88_17540 [Bradyrhizobium sp. CCBAU 51627]|nr:hypothetical protein [Bradyrhizobium sp. CCBAU 51627]
MTFATLGPAGTNHEFVTKEYIKFHGIPEAKIVLVPDFDVAMKGLINSEYDFILQCAVHPDTPSTLGTHFRRMFAVDSFICRSKELAILTRSDVETPKSIGLLAPATESYIDVSRWQTRVSEPSLPIIFENLLKEKYDSALVYLEYAEQYPDRVRVDQVIGSPDDVWIVYANERTSKGKLQAWHEGPVRELIRQKVESDGLRKSGGSNL